MRVLRFCLQSFAASAGKAGAAASKDDDDDVPDLSVAATLDSSLACSVSM